MNNPFFYIEANSLNPDDLINYFIDEYNHNEYIQSSKNIFLIGERGSGKSMTLKFSSFPVQKLYDKKRGMSINYTNIGVYVQVSPVLFEKKEFELISDPLKMALLCEHYFVLVTSLNLIETIYKHCKDILSLDDKKRFRKKIKTIFDIIIAEDDDPFEGLYDVLKSNQNKTQKALLSINENYPEDTLSFFSFLLPLIDILKSLECFHNAHFNFLIDDAQNLNEYQQKLLSSWIGYRDHSDYSLKISITRPENFKFFTTNDSAILEGHDYIARYTEGRFQNQFSDFGKLADKIIHKRIELLGLGEISAYDFFPINESFKADLKRCKGNVRKKAIDKYGSTETKKIDDYVYKYGRAEYFRERNPQANKPPYSGFEIIIHLSTGILRNLLEPCSLMFDKAKDKYKIAEKKHIESDIQQSVIEELCQQKWSSIRDIMPTTVVGCTREKANHIHNLLDRLGDLFRQRLLDTEASEPRAISFTISAINTLLLDEREYFFDLLKIARAHGLIFKRLSSAKEVGKFEVYYTPHRLLWPNKGLDPVGQHARVSIKAKILYDAAIGNKEIKYDRALLEDEDENTLIQKHLFENF
jgi:hypothetical protein